MEKLVRRRELARRLDRCRSATFEDEKKGLITAPIAAGERTRAWPDSEVTVLVEARIAGLTDDQIRAVVMDLMAKRAALREKFLPFIEGGNLKDPNESADPAGSPRVARNRIGRGRTKLAAASPTDQV